MVKQPRRRVQADQPVARAAQRFMPVLELFGEVRVDRHRRRDVEAEVRERFVGGGEHQPGEDRRGDHQPVQRQVHQVRDAGLPGRWLGGDRRAWAQAAEQAHPDQDEDARAEQAVEAHQQAARFAALGHEALDFDAGIHADEQRQHQPVQRN